MLLPLLSSCCLLMFPYMQSFLQVLFFLFLLDSSADPLLDEHFRRSLGEQKYRSLFNEGEGSGGGQRSPPAAQPSPTSSTTSSSAKVSPKSHLVHALPVVVQPSVTAADPVKAFHDDMESEGYTGTTKQLLQCSA